eukprot:3602740-Rhodomonas_salina.2
MKAIQEALLSGHNTPRRSRPSPPSSRNRSATMNLFPAQDLGHPRLRKQPSISSTTGKKVGRRRSVETLELWERASETLRREDAGSREVPASPVSSQSHWSDTAFSSFSSLSTLRTSSSSSLALLAQSLLSDPVQTSEHGIPCPESSMRRHPDLIIGALSREMSESAARL